MKPSNCDWTVTSVIYSCCPACVVLHPIPSIMGWLSWIPGLGGGGPREVDRSGELTPEQHVARVCSHLDDLVQRCIGAHLSGLAVSLSTKLLSTEHFCSCLVLNCGLRD